MCVLCVSMCVCVSFVCGEGGGESASVCVYVSICVCIFVCLLIGNK